MNIQEDIDSILLGASMVKGVGNQTLRDMYNKKNIDGFDIVNLVESLKTQKEVIYENSQKKKKVLSAAGIHYKTIASQDYPKQLLEMPDAPAIIYYKGTWNNNIFKQCFTIVGTRKPSEYGKKYTRRFAKEIGDMGFTIVSGLAFGIDREAHLASIESSSKTIAVLASSPHKPSPTSNYDVYKKILDSDGLIISEIDPLVKVVPGMFASRNRIVAGLSVGTLVIEASKKSGSLITADLAIQYNKEVFAIPADIDRESFSGSNELIKTGAAKLVQTSEDIFVELGYTIPKYLKREVIDALDEKEMKVVEVLQKTELFVQEISQEIGLEVSSLSVILAKLELKGFIKKTIAGKYILK